MSVDEDGEDLYRFVEALPGGERDPLGPVDHEWRVVRAFPAASEDGRPATVWAQRWPAQFFRLTSGDVEITTGSGAAMGHLMLRLADAIARGMVGFRLRACS